MLGQQANHRLAAGIGLLQRLLPPFPGPDAGVGVQVQEISSASPGSCSISHALTATACAVVPARMTQKHPQCSSPPSAQASAHRAMIAGSQTLGGRFDLRGKAVTVLGSPSARASKSSGYQSPHAARQFGGVILEGDPVLAVVVQLADQDGAVWGHLHAVRHVGIRRRSWGLRDQVLRPSYSLYFEIAFSSARAWSIWSNAYVAMAAVLIVLPLWASDS